MFRLSIHLDVTMKTTCLIVNIFVTRRYTCLIRLFHLIVVHRNSGAWGGVVVKAVRY